jgi:hypothetical protein
VTEREQGFRDAIEAAAGIMNAHADNDWEESQRADSEGDLDKQELHEGYALFSERVSKEIRALTPPRPAGEPQVFETREEAARSGMWVGPPLKEPETLCVPAGESAPSPAPVARLRELLAKANPGEWTVSGWDLFHGTTRWEATEFFANIDVARDAALIVAAVNALGPLLDVCEAAQRLDERRIIGQPVSGAEADLHEALARVQP